MGRRIWVVVAFIVLGIVAGMLYLAAFGSSQVKQGTNIIEYKSGSIHVQLRVETDKATYLVGETIEVRVLQKNLGEEPIQGGPGEVKLVILNSRGEVVKSGLALYSWPPDFKIMPMEEVDLHLFSQPWNQTNNNGEQVPPDTYTIRLTIDGDTIETQVTIIGD